MKVVNLASEKSAWRGYEYYKDGKVISYERIADNMYQGKVRGSDDAVYSVTLNIVHPRSSSCDCPLANGKQIVCKHLVALYFAIYPQDAVEYKKQVDQAQAEYEAWLEGVPERVEKYVRKLSKAELQEQLLDILFNSEDWLLDRYIREHDIDED